MSDEPSAGRTARTEPEESAADKTQGPGSCESRLEEVRKQLRIVSEHPRANAETQVDVVTALRAVDDVENSIRESPPEEGSA